MSINCPLSDGNETHEQDKNECDDEDGETTLPSELLGICPAPKTGLRALQAREASDDVVDAGHASLKVSLVTLSLD